jgi:peptidoglycan/xylan/chitin deacetylase (PgdA/CDA1 family)
MAAMKLNWDGLLVLLGRWTPKLLLKHLLRVVLGNSQVALCLHRAIPNARVSHWKPDLSCAPEQIDSLIDLLLSTRKDCERWLTVTFDDGYADAARYVESRAVRYPFVEFLLFVCPEKVERRAGFRWDLVEKRVNEGEPFQAVAGYLKQELDLDAENRRPELLEVGADPHYTLAGVEQLRSLARFPNVAVGNHTDCHFPVQRLSREQVEEEFARSAKNFIRLFGPSRHFAFPFGTPEAFFDASHVARLRSQGDFLIWSTEARPYAVEERAPRAVLPRLVVHGTWGIKGVAMWIVAQAARFRLFGTAHRYPAQPEDVEVPRRAVAVS